MRSLFLQQNLIKKIEGLDTLVNLCVLNISHNNITKIENLSHNKELTSLNLNRNNIKGTTNSIILLHECKSIDNLDLSQNNIEKDHIEDIDDFLQVFIDMENIKVL